MSFPTEHWRRIHSTNVLERLNRELARRCDVVGIFPNVAAALRLLGALLEEQQDEWLVSRRSFSLESWPRSMRLHSVRTLSHTRTRQHCRY